MQRFHTLGLGHGAQLFVSARTLDSLDLELCELVDAAPSIHVRVSRDVNGSAVIVPLGRAEELLGNVVVRVSGREISVVDMDE
jgi:hypothetical protein